MCFHDPLKRCFLSYKFCSKGLTRVICHVKNGGTLCTLSVTFTRSYTYTHTRTRTRTHAHVVTLAHCTHSCAHAHTHWTLKMRAAKVVGRWWWAVESKTQAGQKPGWESRKRSMCRTLLGRTHKIGLPLLPLFFLTRSTDDFVCVCVCGHGCLWASVCACVCVVVCLLCVVCEGDRNILACKRTLIQVVSHLRRGWSETSICRCRKRRVGTFGHSKSDNRML